MLESIVGQISCARSTQEASGEGQYGEYHTRKQKGLRELYNTNLCCRVFNFFIHCSDDSPKIQVSPHHCCWTDTPAAFYLRKATQVKLILIWWAKSDDSLTSVMWQGAPDQTLNVVCKILIWLVTSSTIKDSMAVDRIICVWHCSEAAHTGADWIYFQSDCCNFYSTHNL